MTFDEYLNRYRLLQHALERDERSLALMQKAPCRQFLHQLEGTSNATLQGVILTREVLQNRIFRRKRICQRYALRLARAIGEISVPELREYATFHYLYGLTHEEIAESSFYSVRTVYRHGKKAKKALEEALLRVGPKRKEIPSSRFHVKGRLPRKNYGVDRISRSIATLTARRNSLPYRPVYL